MSNIRTLIRGVVKTLRDGDYHVNPFSLSDINNVVIVSSTMEDSEYKEQHVFQIKHDLYDLFCKAGFKPDKELTKPSVGGTRQSFYRDNVTVTITTMPVEVDGDFEIEFSETVMKLTASDRLSYRLPKLKRGELGTGEYSVHLGEREIGKIRAAGKNHDKDSPNWTVELYEGFDHLAYPDNEKEDLNLGEPHVVYDRDRDNLKLFSGESFTVKQSRHWVKSVFDRQIWESGLVPY